VRPRDPLVQHGGAAAGAQNALRLAQRGQRIGDDGEDQVQEDGVVRGVRQLQRLRVHHPSVDGAAEGGGAAAGALDHGGGEVRRGYVHADGQVVEVGAGAAAVHQHPLARPQLQQPAARRRCASIRTTASYTGAISV
jgi:hypothetical protein